MSYYIVAGLGRCGTDLLFNAIREKIHNENGTAPGGFKRYLNILYGPAMFSDICTYQNGEVYKTHDYPAKHCLEMFPDGRTIFMFGDPIDLVLSAQYNTNTEEHYLNLRADPRDANTFKFLSKDTMRLEDMFKAWTSVESPNVLRVRYETMWDNIDKINDFLGIEIELPPKRERTTNRYDYPEDHIRCMEKTYGNLTRLISMASDIF